MGRNDNLLLHVLRRAECVLLGKENVQHIRTGTQCNIHHSMVISCQEWERECFSVVDRSRTNAFPTQVDPFGTVDDCSRPCSIGEVQKCTD